MENEADECAFVLPVHLLVGWRTLPHICSLIKLLR